MGYRSPERNDIRNRTDGMWRLELMRYGSKVMGPCTTEKVWVIFFAAKEVAFEEKLIKLHHERYFKV